MVFSPASSLIISWLARARCECWHHHTRLGSTRPGDKSHTSSLYPGLWLVQPLVFNTSHPQYWAVIGWASTQSSITNNIATLEIYWRPFQNNEFHSSAPGASERYEQYEHDQYLANNCNLPSCELQVLRLNTNIALQQIIFDTNNCLILFMGPRLSQYVVRWLVVTRLTRYKGTGGGGLASIKQF